MSTSSDILCTTFEPNLTKKVLNIVINIKSYKKIIRSLTNIITKKLSNLIY